jgi:hypothetical protein
MGLLKGLGTGFLSFLLLLSLSVLGVAFMLSSTVLNPDFIVRQAEKLDISTITRDIVDEQISEDLSEQAEFLKEAAYAVIAEREPWIKEQLDSAVYTGYDFLLGKSDRLEITIPLESLKTDFKESLWQTLKEFLKQNASLIPEDLLVPYLTDYFQELTSQIPQQLLPPEMAGLAGNALDTYLRQHYDQVTDLLQTALMIPGLSGWIQDEIRPYFDEYYDDFVKDLPSEYVIDEEEIPADVMEQLWLARKYTGYFRTGYYALIAFMVLLLAGVALIHRNIRDTSRALGITFIVYGVLEFTGVLVARSLNLSEFIADLSALPASLETWLAGLFRDFLAPLQWFSLGILILGAVLLAVSFVYRPPTAPD